MLVTIQLLAYVTLSDNVKKILYKVIKIGGLHLYRVESPLPIYSTD